MIDLGVLILAASNIGAVVVASWLEHREAKEVARVRPVGASPLVGSLSARLFVPLRRPPGFEVRSPSSPGSGHGTAGRWSSAPA
jgi:hypothetical protein